MTHPLFWRSHLEILRGDPAAALSAAEALERLGREQRMPFWRIHAELDAAWARGRIHDRAAGAEELRRALTALADSGERGWVWFDIVLLAELEGETVGPERALTRIDEALALAAQVENRCNLPFPHLLRGELRLKRDPSDCAPAEDAFQTALAIAKEQGARSWGLRAALALAKLYQATGRPAEAHAVLARALEGFSALSPLPFGRGAGDERPRATDEPNALTPDPSPSWERGAAYPEMPEIAEAQALLAALAEAHGAKDAAAPGSATKSA
jgi:hypothetical protein